MHGAVCAQECKDGRDKANKERKTLAFIASRVKEQCPYIMACTLLRSHDSESNEYDEEEGNVKGQNSLLRSRQEFREKCVED